jgi:hypothetical protein
MVFTFSGRDRRYCSFSSSSMTSGRLLLLYIKG